MRNATAAVAASLLVFSAGYPAFTGTAADPDQSKPAPSAIPAKPMAMKEPMAGEMKKDGMMKEDVSKAQKKWSKEMDEKMKQEKMK